MPPTSTRSAGRTSAWASCRTRDKNLREAYRREPADPTIEEHIGDLEARQGNMEGAIRHWEKALALKHDEPDRVREKLQKARAPVSQR